MAVNNLAGVLRETGDYPAAELLFRRALDGFEAAHGPTHPLTLVSIGNLADLYFHMRRYADAVPLFDRAARGYSARPELAPRAPALRGSLGLALLATGKPADAEPPLLAAHAGLSGVKSPHPLDRKRLRLVTQALAEIYATTDQPTKAAEWRAKLAALPPEVAPPPRTAK